MFPHFFIYEKKGKRILISPDRPITPPGKPAQVLFPSMRYNHQI